MPITNQEIDDLLVTAFEGGINYWAEKIKCPLLMYPVTCVSEGATVIITLREPHDEAGTWEYTLTKGNVMKGIRRAAEQMGQSTTHFVENHDIEGADIAVQFALFDEIVYG